MLSIPPQTRVFLYREPTDMRKSFHGLVALTESVLRQDPLSGPIPVPHYPERFSPDAEEKPGHWHDRKRFPR